MFQIPVEHEIGFPQHIPDIKRWEQEYGTCFDWPGRDWTVIPPDKVGRAYKRWSDISDRQYKNLLRYHDEFSRLLNTCQGCGEYFGTYQEKVRHSKRCAEYARAVTEYKAGKKALEVNCCNLCNKSFAGKRPKRYLRNHLKSARHLKRAVQHPEKHNAIVKLNNLGDDLLVVT